MAIDFTSLNTGNLDRGARVVLGGALIALSAMGTLPVWGYIGVVPLLTGLAGRCPAYSLFGINTCSMKKSNPG
ncbi:MAG: DUF2892 domain-containing protein [Myxococcales bacterium]|nr:DUF2892 domain-containing protein [Myxococcales bacterium]